MSMTYLFYIYKMRVDTPGQGPSPSEMGEPTPSSALRAGDKSRPYIYCLRSAYTHICLTSFLIVHIAKLCFISIIDKALLQD